MIGIKEIATYLPQGRISNEKRKEKFEVDDDFLKDKIGILEVAVKDENEDTSDMAAKAFYNLEKKSIIDKGNIDVIVLITQNPDKNIPHSSAIIHKKLELPERCAAFDISLGCSGYVYGLSIVTSFMQSNGFKNGLLFTCDPYSKIISPEDKNTALLFGDAATVTHLTENPEYYCGKFTFGTIGNESHNLEIQDGVLFMNGRSIFNFAAKYVPSDVKILCEKNNITLEEIDKFVFHQGSKYIVDTLARRIALDSDKVVNDILHYGNTVSSSIPIILEKLFKEQKNKTILISGFGVGLSWSSNIIYKNK